MTSIQLPPLQFEDGGFRVSIITGPSTANAPGASEAKPVSDTESEPNSEPERDQNQDAHVTPEPQRIPPPQPLPLKLEVPVEYSTKAEPEVESEPKPHHDSKPDPDTETTPVAVSKPAPIPVPESTPVPKPELEAVAASTTAPAPESEVVDVPTCLLVGHHEEDLPAPEETPQPPSVPQHPIGSLQRAFAESLDEVTKGGADKPRLRDLDAKARRERLLEQDKDEEPFDARWRYRPGQTQHEVPKLISQISFGVYLLLNGMANDNSQVISILQGHIDEVDEFLEVTLEDFAQAATDLNERLDYLKLPMSNVKVFEEMLEDRNYRAEILEGNEKIEQVLARMNVIMKQWEGDIEAGLQGTAAFNEWLNSLRSGSWRHEHPELVEIFDAMRGNAEGWLNAFDEMDSKTRSMNGLITQLMTIVAEMERKAGEVSRKTWSSIPPFTSPTSGSLRSKRDNSSISSPPSVRSNPRSTTRVSVRSGSISAGQHFQSDDDLDDGLCEFPLPGVAPLLPPPRSAARIPKRPSVEAPKLQVGTAPKPSPVVEATPEEEREDSPLYILQPRTYTPQPPEPLPSPLVRDSPTTPSSPRAQRFSDQAPIPVDAQSIDQRVSSPKEDIRISAGDARDRSGSRASPVITSSMMSSPRRSSHSNWKMAVQDPGSSNLQVRDSAGSSLQIRDSSGSEMDGLRQHRMPRVGSHADLRPSRPSLMQSPNSDYQHYHPVLASPHSPLQQRPHTAAGPASQAHRPPSYFPNQVRNQPSRLGSMATLDSIASSAKDNHTVKPNAPSVAGGQTLKKKKSAFGWFKKAFTMDDEERAAFEARKNIQQPGNYYKDKSPKFLDGRRIR